MLARHDVVGAAIGFSRDDRELRHGRFRVGVEELGAVADDPGVLLRRPGEETGHVDEGHERDVEGIAKADEPCRFDRGIDVQDAREDHRLLGDDADRSAVEPRESADDVLRPAFVHLEDLPVVNDAADDVLHVVGLVRGVGDDVVENGVLPTRWILGSDDRRRIEIV